VLRRGRRAHLERAVAVSEALGSDHPYVGAHLLGLAELYAQVGDPARRPTIDRALAILTEPTLARAAALGLRADLRQDEADLVGARADFEAARALVAASSAHDPGDLDSYEASLAQIDVEEGHYASARARIDAAIASAAARLGATHPDVAMLRAHRARIRMAQGETREARTEYEAALAAHPHIRWALVDHVSSPMATLIPVASVVAACHARGVSVMVDGAHSPGQLPLELRSLGADWFTGNLHKWAYTLKGVGESGGG
jgi:tetratricopeptide (TPR) repeat protein